jgi:hypothetical protein
MLWKLPTEPQSFYLKVYAVFGVAISAVAVISCMGMEES